MVSDALKELNERGEEALHEGKMAKIRAERDEAIDEILDPMEPVPHPEYPDRDIHGRWLKGRVERHNLPEAGTEAAHQAAIEGRAALARQRAERRRRFEMALERATTKRELERIVETLMLQAQVPGATGAQKLLLEYLVGKPGEIRSGRQGGERLEQLLVQIVNVHEGETEVRTGNVTDVESQSQEQSPQRRTEGAEETE